ncbi:hypothetical protein BDY17DRAFT_310634 [Neohortaea acidophila]|uniref:DUF1223-domain-containing protein n=1 Tax=Neohortaea acidophila TaxID=245834 RepID=A0A6A6PW11_9PEZI|nr:uncharacterized protein BDY17DRAFT_310634 [Neohortaea acidophila]KAF2483673.1 hypothetical protein BDY17DRAFT_310634 [Neohortaea acidophila]
MPRIISKIKSLVFKKKRVPLACEMSLDSTHTHTDACFVEIAPLSIVELFQSQGCESCPPAIPAIHKATDHNPNILLLSYDVTYWDGRSGWKDTHGNSTWDARQRAYVMKWGRQGIFTPQVIIDGISDGVGRQEGEVNDILAKAVEVRNNMELSVGLEKASGADLKIASETAETEKYDVLLVTYDPKAETVKIGGGPNKGKKVVHKNVVKDVLKIDEWEGGNTTVALPNFGADGFERVALLQQGEGGQIVAAAKV